MGHWLDNSTEIGKIAFEIYVWEMSNDPNIHEHAADWWFFEYPEQFKEYYKKAEIKMRNEKLKKILNG